jgi:hypothetical protein
MAPNLGRSIEAEPSDWYLLVLDQRKKPASINPALGCILPIGQGASPASLVLFPRSWLAFLCKNLALLTGETRTPPLKVTRKSIVYQ